MVLTRVLTWFGSRLDRKQDNHGRVWDNIFQDEAWTTNAIDIGANPKLIGSDLEAYYKYRRDDRLTLSVSLLC